MKFSDGEWLMQPGILGHHPVQVHEVAAAGNTLTLHATTRAVRHRGDTLGGPMLTIRLTAPADEVIHVSIEHFSGGTDRNPRIPRLAQKPSRVAIENGRQEVVLRAGRLAAHVKKDGWELAFKAGGRLLTRTAERGIGYVQRAGGETFVHERLQLGVGECVYGLGERFTAFVKNGQVVENENKDGGTGSEQAYKAVPFYLTNRGYGVLVDTTGPVSFEVASERVSRVQFSVPGERLDYFIIHGPTPKEVLGRLTALTGRPALPPAWSFGLWLSTSFTTDYDEKTCTRFIEGMRARRLPLHVFHFDCFWMRAFNWCDFEWDPRVFRDPAGMLRRLHRLGVRVCVWINPYVSQRSRLFAEGRARGYLVRRANGDVWQTDLWQPGMAIVDFTNPAAARWFAGHLRRLVAMGVDCFKTDFGERIPVEDVVYHDGSDPAGMHNFYPVLYNACVFGLLERVRGRGEAVVFARSAYASSQRFPVHWGGDCWSTFESMAESLRGGLSLGLCGFGFWSHDIGGFEGQAPAAVYKRWVAFGLLSSHSRLHGSSSYRVPWNYDEEACDVLRFFTRLKCRLMPYLYGQAVTAHEEGLPLMRAMMLEFPDDPAADTLDRQYMLGESLLVAPVFTAEGAVNYYLPEGRWTHLLSGEVETGGRWRRAKHGFLSLPLFVRPGTILPVGAVDDRPDYDFTAGTTFRVYELADGAAAVCRVPSGRGGEGIRLEVSRRGRVLEAGLGPAAAGRSWKLQLAGVSRVAAVEGGTAEKHPLGVELTPARGVRRLRVTLAPAS
ncbi:MAG TPA: alpha-xylosidase [Opitutaceae bacterium]|nr:alpha-xylosidase [Opitutaceae bacterium]